MPESSYAGMSYAGIIRCLIRKRYSVDDELAIHRQKEVKEDEFLAYFQYAEECKNKAKQIMEGKNSG